MGALDLGDKAQIIASVATSVAALAALITTIQNRCANKKMDKERHAMVKPTLIVNSVSEDRRMKKITIELKNIGFKNIRDINPLWDGNSYMEVELKSAIIENEINKKILCCSHRH